MRPSARPVVLAVVFLAACAKPVSITIRTDRADLLAEPKAGAKVVGELLPGKALEATRPGPFGAKGFYRVRAGDQDGYVSEAQAAPVPLPAKRMVVIDDLAFRYSDRALSQLGERLPFGTVIDVYEESSDEKALVLVKDGLRAEFVKREETVPAPGAQERLAAKVVEAARAGRAVTAVVRADALKGDLAPPPPVQALVEALRQAEAADVRAVRAAPPLRTGGPPEAGDRAFVVPFSLPAYDSADLSGVPLALLALGQPLEVLELGERAAQVTILPLASAQADPSVQLSGTPVEPELPQEPVFVDARALQREELRADDLRARAQELAGKGKDDARFELLARAAALSGAPPEELEKLFDEAFAAGAMRWAAWAAQRWRFGTLIVWTAAAADAEELTQVPPGLDSIVPLAAEVIDARQIEGVDPEAHLVAAGFCPDGEPVTRELLAFLDELRPGGTEVRRVRLPQGGPAIAGLQCPAFQVGEVNNCDRKSFWSVRGRAEVAVGKRTLRAWQLGYESSSCGDWYEAQRGVATVFYLYDRKGHVIDVEVSTATLQSNLQVAFNALEASVEASGSVIVATNDTEVDACESRYYEIWREGMRAKVQGDEIVLEELRRKRVLRGECLPADELYGD